MRIVINDYQSKAKEHEQAMAALRKAKEFVNRVKAKRKVHRLFNKGKIIECTDGYRDSYDENLMVYEANEAKHTLTQNRNKEIVRLHDLGLSFEERKTKLNLALKDKYIKHIIKMRDKWK